MCETDTWVDDQVRGLEVDFTCEFVKCIRGSREYYGGPPLEPDENVYRYIVTGVRMYEVEVDICLLKLDEYYEDEVNMAEDVSEKMTELIEERMGETSPDRT